eukprot:TRINITY_DN10258_c0_g1_i2.p1 TRINITY_DN10258_c0_g1~~TRINITY_DN10258_c0_g1_i2.p1  ORF type:complete len:632 (+),score=144.55 TRINITY_DN10258_c0_g1_i2:61-1896(+)
MCIRDRESSVEAGRIQIKEKLARISTKDLVRLQDLAHKMRIHSINMTEKAGSGHATSCASIAEIMAALFFHPEGMVYDPANPQLFQADKLVLSKGHAAPILYACWCECGFLHSDELMNFRTLKSNLEGHPTPHAPFVDVATGSLGQGLSITCGMAFSSKYIDSINNLYYVIIGDGELSEGSNWEGINFASYYKLDNIIAILDVNRFGQSGETMFKHNVEVYSSRFRAFGWDTFEVDGHSFEEIIEALKMAKNPNGKPKILIAKTLKGKYFIDEIEDKATYHGKIFGSLAEVTTSYLTSLIQDKTILQESEKVEKAELNRAHMFDPMRDHNLARVINNHPPKYEKGQQHLVRTGYGMALKKLAEADKKKALVILDADTKNSTLSSIAQGSSHGNFIECFIAEELMVSLQVGFWARGKVAFSSTFASFFTRAYDQVRMASISRANIKFYGSHCGISVGRDGPSQMGLEDIAYFRTIPGSVVLYPADAVACEYAVQLAANTVGMVYIRTSREVSPVIYDNHETFEIGGSKRLKYSEEDLITIVSCGLTLVEALSAAEILEQQGIKVGVIDLFSVKPVDSNMLILAGSQSKHGLLTVEDHFEQGGIFCTLNLFCV